MKKDGILRTIGLGLSLCGIAIMLYGAFRGETEVVFRKAVNICLECIGIG